MTHIPTQLDTDNHPYFSAVHSFSAIVSAKKYDLSCVAHPLLSSSTASSWKHCYKSSSFFSKARQKKEKSLHDAAQMPKKRIRILNRGGENAKIKWETLSLFLENKSRLHFIISIAVERKRLLSPETTCNKW